MDMSSNIELEGLERRVLDLERQISMYERLFQTFSAKLDHHFKKYDLVLNAQQQQINVLTDVVSTMLNDQYRYAGVLRDKLAGSLDGIITTSGSIGTIQPNGSMLHTQQHTQQQHTQHQHQQERQEPQAQTGQPSRCQGESQSGGQSQQQQHTGGQQVGQEARQIPEHRRKLSKNSHGHPSSQDEDERDLTNVDAILGEFIPPQVSPDDEEMQGGSVPTAGTASSSAGAKRNGMKKHSKGPIEHKFIISNGRKSSSRGGGDAGVAGSHHVVSKRRRGDFVPHKEYEFRDDEFSTLGTDSHHGLESGAATSLTDSYSQQVDDDHPHRHQQQPQRPQPQSQSQQQQQPQQPQQQHEHQRPDSVSIPPGEESPALSSAPSSSSHLDTNVKEEQYYTHRGLKKKRKIYVGKFEFLNSPQTVMDIWKEYTEGYNGQPSLRDMELMYQTSWRRDAAVNKRFHRRKVLCKAIERGLERGYDLNDVVRVLEESRIIDSARNLKQPIGWLCQGVNIPDMFK
ncbi:Msn1p Ecym_2058 [Eremothecium cymbalariae DBVPG|uniref:Transcription activator GCR1-like domain-containing protein n=1 Tax=Eremothecium cymbalariae (strain CBS 270.75 / DBVPG 7215 / KCTC 17166 / NRRL Y-17582) TaxID=931890 RepID=G8JP15_ERECY|nr:Hypothetical protein Ecym_2058 [Eremothecium cymbalariae DBVPG\